MCRKEAGKREKKAREGRWEGEERKRGREAPAFFLFSSCTVCLLFSNFNIYPTEASADVNGNTGLANTRAVSLPKRDM